MAEKGFDQIPLRPYLDPSVRELIRDSYRNGEDVESRFNPEQISAFWGDPSEVEWDTLTTPSGNIFFMPYSEDDLQRFHLPGHVQDFHRRTAAERRKSGGVDAA